MKKVLFYGIVGVLLLLGIILCETVMQFGSVFFLTAAALIGWLMRYALQKQTGRGIRKAAAFLLALALIIGVFWAFNELFGNPITKNTAKEAVQEYLEEAYEGRSLYIESVSYNMSAGSYEAWIAGKDGGFLVSWRDGRILYDTFGES